MENEATEPSQKWMERDVRDDVRRFAEWTKENKTAIVIVVIWAIAIGAILIWEYYSVYAANPILRGKWSYAYVSLYSSYGYPRLSQFDHYAIFALSLIAGFAIYRVEATIFGFLCSAVLSFIIGTSYGTFFIWYILDFKSAYSISAISYAIWAAFANVFRMAFPVAIIIMFVGSILGCLIRDILRPPR